MNVKDIKIRAAAADTLPEIQKVFDQARAAIAALGIDQWQDGYPSDQRLIQDIEQSMGYALMLGGKVVGYFVLMITPEPTYATVYDGAWLTEGNSYVTLHRVALSDELRGSGAADLVVSYAIARALRMGAESVRIDTHEGNLRMRRFLDKQGFAVCGNIRLESGAMRVGYERDLRQTYQKAPVVLYEDRNILICEKPVGQPSQPDPSHADGSDLLTCAQNWRNLCGYTGQIYLVHRLDTATGGAILFAKDRESAAKLGGMVVGKQISKQYLAVVHGTLTPEKGRMIDLLYHDKAQNKAFVVKTPRNGVKEARLSYRTLAQSDGCSLLEVILETGRTHQIRAQLSHAGHPLLGDGKYGSREKGCTTALWATRLGVIHPMTKRLVEVQSNPPKGYPWSLFDM